MALAIYGLFGYTWIGYPGPFLLSKLRPFFLLTRTSSKNSNVQLLLLASCSVANNWTSEGEGGIFKVKKRLCGFHFNLSILFLITGNYKLAVVQRQTEILNSCSLYKIHNSSPASLGLFSLAQWMCTKQSWDLSWKTHGLRGSIEKCCVGKQSSLFAALQMIGFHFIRCFHCLLKASADAKQCGPAIAV